MKVGKLAVILTIALSIVRIAAADEICNDSGSRLLPNLATSEKIIVLRSSPLSVVLGSQGGVGLSRNTDGTSPDLLRDMEDADSFPAALVFGTPTSRFNVETGFLRESKTSLDQGYGESFMTPMDYGVLSYPGVVVGNVGVVNLSAPYTLVEGVHGVDRKTTGSFIKTVDTKYLRETKLELSMNENNEVLLTVTPQSIQGSFYTQMVPQAIPSDEVLVSCDFPYHENAVTNACVTATKVTTMPVSVKFPDSSTREGRIIMPVKIELPEKPAHCTAYTTINFPSSKVGIKNELK